MNTLTELFSTSAAQRIGWALIHSVWQGTAVALLLAVTLAMLRHRSAQARWVVSCTALALMAMLPVATALVVPVEAPRPPEPVPAAIAADRMPPPGGSAESARGPVSPALPEITHNPKPLEAAPLSVQHAPTAQEQQTARLAWPQQLQGAIQPALPWATGVWLAGVLAMSVWHIGGWLQVRRMGRLGTRAASAAAQERFDRVLQRLRIGRPVRLLESLRVAVPVVVGWLRPVILLPVGAATGLTPRQLEAILAHELAHIRRWDCLVQALQAVLETLLFYHPAVWWVSRQVRQESEHCCDDLAVGICADRSGYAHTLAKVAELGAAGSRGSPGKPAFAAAATGGKLLPRIRRILGFQADRCRYGRPHVAAVVTLGILLAVGVFCACSPGDGSASVGAADVPAREKPSPVSGRALTRRGGTRVADADLDRVIGELKGNDSEARSAAAKALGEMGPKAAQAVPALMHVLGGIKAGAEWSARNDEGAAHIIWALGQIGEPAVPRLIQAVEKGQSPLRERALWILQGIGPQAKAAAPALAAILRNDAEPLSLRGRAATALGAIRSADAEVVATLVSALTAKQWSLRKRTAEALGEIGPPAELCVPALAKALTEPDSDVNRAAADALGKMAAKSDKALAPLLKVIRDTDLEEHKRARAVRGLVQMGPAAEKVLPNLIAALGDNSANVRVRAAEVLTHLGPRAKDAVPALVARLKDDQWWVRREAVRALGAIGPAAKSAEEALRASLDDPMKEVRDAAADALQRITVPPPTTQPGAVPQKVEKARQAEVGFVARVMGVSTATDEGNVEKVHPNPRLSVRLRIVSVDRAGTPLQVDEQISFAVHSVAQILGQPPQSVSGRKYSFRVVWHPGPPSRFSRLTLDPPIMQAAVDATTPLDGSWATLIAKAHFAKTNPRLSRRLVDLSSPAWVKGPGGSGWLVKLYDLEPNDNPSYMFWEVLESKAHRVVVLAPDGSSLITDPKDVSSYRKAPESPTPAPATQPVASAPRTEPGGAEGVKVVLPILRSLKQDVVELGKGYPQLADAKAIEVTADGWSFEHDCRDLGKRGYENTGPFPIAIGLRVMTAAQFRARADKVEMQFPSHRWEYLGLVGWTTLHTGPGVPGALVGELQAALRQSLVTMGRLNRQALAAKLPRAIQQQRDRLLAEADAAIRKGVQALAERHPLLKKGKPWDRLALRSNPGRIGIYLRRQHGGKGGTDAKPFPPGEAFGILVVIEPPPDEIGSLVLMPLYRHLGLVGQVGIRAADPQLDAALRKLVSDALAPLSKLERRASALPATRPAAPGAEGGGARSVKAVLPALQSLKQDVVKLGKGHPQLAKAEAVAVTADGWLFEHDCGGGGKRGYVVTGPFPVAVGLRIMTMAQFHVQVGKVAMQLPGHRWGALGLVGWSTLYTGPDIPAALARRLQDALKRAVATIGQLERRASAPQAPAALEKWLAGKEVVEVCFAGPHMAPRKLRDSLKLKVPANDWDFRLTPGEGGGANRSFVEVCMKVTPENARRLLALQKELAPRGYRLDPEHTHVWVLKGDPKARAKAREKAAAILADAAVRIRLALPKAQTRPERPRGSLYLAGVQYEIPGTKITGMIRISEVTAAKRWELPVSADQRIHLPRLALMVLAYYRPGRPTTRDASLERVVIRKAVREAVAPLLKLEGDTVRVLEPPLPRAAWLAPAPAGDAARLDKARAEFLRIFDPDRRQRILAMTRPEALKIVRSEKDFRRLFEVCYWCKLRGRGIARDLVGLLTDARPVGLTHPADLIIFERIESGHLTFQGHGRIVDDDLFTVAGRASWLLKEITGRDPGRVSMKSTAKDLAALAAKWRAIVAPAPG